MGTLIDASSRFVARRSLRAGSPRVIDASARFVARGNRRWLSLREALVALSAAGHPHHSYRRGRELESLRYHATWGYFSVCCCRVPVETYHRRYYVASDALDAALAACAEC